MNDFRQMISLIKLNAFCNYHAGFEEHPIPPFQPEGRVEILMEQVRLLAGLALPPGTALQLAPPWSWW